MELNLLIKIVGISILVLLSVVDICKQKIPVFIPLIFGIASIFIKAEGEFFNALCGCIPGVLMMMLYWVSRGQIGIGDGLLVIGMGASLGGGNSFKAFILSLGFIFIFSCVGLFVRKLSKNTRLPYVPFYAVAYIGVVLI